MNYTVLSKLAWTDKAPALKLRLLHTWMGGNPLRPDFAEFATLWTDEKGVLVQGLAPAQLASGLQESLAVGGIYYITQFTQRESKKRWAPCSNDRNLQFTSNTAFLPSPDDDSSFCADSFEFRQLEELEPLAKAPQFLVDVVGRLISVTPVTYFQKQERTRRKQTVVLENERKKTLSITLWADFADRLALPELVQMDAAAPVIVAFTSLNLSTWRGNVGASNTSATRIVVSPRVLQTQSLAVHFGDAIGTIGILPTECDTPQKALTIYRDSFRTIPELQLIQSTASMGGKFRCKVTITDIDTTRDWCYLGCAICCKAAVRRDAPFWCDKCEATVLPHQLKQCFRIRLMGQDDGSACAPFLLLGHTAETLLLVSANALFAASPDRVNGYPPEILELVGQQHVFMVNLAVGQVSHPLDDLCVSGFEKEEPLDSIERKPHGPYFHKKKSNTIATVANSIASSQQTFLPGSTVPMLESPTKRLRSTHLSDTTLSGIVPEDGEVFTAPRPPRVLLISGVAGASVDATCNPVLPALQNPTTPVKSSEKLSAQDPLPNFHSPGASSLSSPLAQISIVDVPFDKKKKGILTDASVPEKHGPLPCPSTDIVNASAEMGSANFKDKKQVAVTSSTTIPPSMLPINPVGHPLAKVKIEKLETALKNKKKQAVDDDDIPISRLKTKNSKRKPVAKKLFDA